MELESVDVNDWMNVIREASYQLECSWGGGNAPSPFKIMAAFAVAIVEKAPIPETISPALSERNGLDPDIARYPRALAATVAFEMAKDFLAGAKVGSSQALKPLDNPIRISRHFYRDLIFTMAIGIGAGPMSLVLEACCYQTNDDAQNGDRV